MHARRVTTLRVLASAASFAVVTGMVTVAPAEAAAKPITGTLSKAGYRVVAMTPGGKARTARVAADGSFTVVPKGPVVTLNLVTTKGRYAGPVVVGGTATRAVLGVEAGTRLGTVRVRPGWARARPGRSHVVTSMWAKARDHRPVGARRNGLVRAKSLNSVGAGRDQDADGVVGAFDIDDDGDLRIDNFERSSGGRAFSSLPEHAYTVFSNYPLDIADSINANAGNLDQIATTFPESLVLSIWVPPAPATAELDCLGLSYCSTGGTGEEVDYDVNLSVKFPEGRDSDGDGWGELVAEPTDGLSLLPHASPDQIRAGDTMIERISPDGVAPQLEQPGVLNFVFQTTPALHTWSVAGGGSGTVSYPVTSATSGTVDNPIPVPQGSGTVTFTFWRPQRAAVPGEAASADGFVDIGGLTYYAEIYEGATDRADLIGDMVGPGQCFNRYISDDDADPTDEGVQDRAPDRPADPANTVSFTLDLDECLGSVRWPQGKYLMVRIGAHTPVGDNASQWLHFVRT